MKRTFLTNLTFSHSLQKSQALFPVDIRSKPPKNTKSNSITEIPPFPTQPLPFLLPQPLFLFLSFVVTALTLLLFPPPPLLVPPPPSHLPLRTLLPFLLQSLIPFFLFPPSPLSPFLLQTLSSLLSILLTFLLLPPPLPILTLPLSLLLPPLSSLPPSLFPLPLKTSK